MFADSSDNILFVMLLADSSNNILFLMLLLFKAFLTLSYLMLL